MQENKLKIHSRGFGTGHQETRSPWWPTSEISASDVLSFKNRRDPVWGGDRPDKLFSGLEAAGSCWGPGLGDYPPNFPRGGPRGHLLKSHRADTS